MTRASDTTTRHAAWNRMVAIAHAYRSSGTVSAGQSSVTMKYDGKGRRIQKAISNTGAWDCTYKYYYDNDSCIEERNGSDYVIKENTWGTNYIDELVQVKAESDGTLSTSALSGTDGRFFACQDANYNVLGLVNASGALVERYEYSPYGQRKVFASAGTNDPENYAPTLASQRASSTAAWAKNEFGHQGLMHDEEIDLVYNRARVLHPGLGRFAQRDKLGNTDGNNLYLYCRGKVHALVDPSGMLPVIFNNPFWLHYYNGNGADFDLGSHGLLPAANSVPEVAAAISAAAAAVPKNLAEVSALHNCRPGVLTAWREHSYMLVAADYTNVPGLFEVGNTFLRVHTDCTFAGLCKCCPKETTSTYVSPVRYDCTITVSILDYFTDPLDLFDIIPGNQGLGGTDYRIVGQISSSSTSGAVDSTIPSWCK